MAMPSTPKPINLALQGGGSHGALTWGALDRLLEDGRLCIGGVSGTSAGAMNAVVMADGFQRGGAEGAREALEKFWRAVSDAARYSPFRRSPWDRLTGRYSLDFSPGYLFFESFSRMFSPYEINPLGLNPLRDLVAQCIDFDRVRACRAIDVFVTATNVRTGQPRVFSQHDVTIDAVLASACLPQMYPAVEIDGEAYWDGGFAANPALYPLIDSLHAPDIVIVQINPLNRLELPRSARDIINRVNEVSFNSALIKELRAIAVLQRIIRERNLDLGPRSRVYLHLVHDAAEAAELSASSKLNAEWEYLRYLFERGRRWADHWLDESFDRIGVGSSLDVEGMFGESVEAAQCMVSDSPRAGGTDAHKSG